MSPSTGIDAVMNTIIKNSSDDMRCDSEEVKQYSRAKIPDTRWLCRAKFIKIEQYISRNNIVVPIENTFSNWVCQK